MGHWDSTTRGNTLLRSIQAILDPLIECSEAISYYPPSAVVLGPASPSCSICPKKKKSLEIILETLKNQLVPSYFNVMMPSRVYLSNSVIPTSNTNLSENMVSSGEQSSRYSGGRCYVVNQPTTLMSNKGPQGFGMKFMGIF